MIFAQLGFLGVNILSFAKYLLNKSTHKIRLTFSCQFDEKTHYTITGFSQHGDKYVNVVIWSISHRVFNLRRHLHSIDRSLPSFKIFYDYHELLIHVKRSPDWRGLLKHKVINKRLYLIFLKILSWAETELRVF